jgi:hypothetical protein
MWNNQVSTYLLLFLYLYDYYNYKYYYKIYNDWNFVIVNLMFVFYLQHVRLGT